jgi:Flp pilus assembly pilin Flp
MRLRFKSKITSAPVPVSPRQSKSRKKGQTLVEYALILAFISVVAISLLISLGKSITGTFSKVTSALASASSH